MEKMYGELAAWWPVLSPPEEYVEEAAFFGRMFAENGVTYAASVLELGCGGGKNAVHLKAHVASMTLTDLSADMLAVSRSLNPECEHVQGDMRTLRLDRMFDAVFIHDAIDYMLTAAALQQALVTAFVHCKPGGLALIVPDAVRETFEPSTDHGGSDGDGRSLRYLEWNYDPDPADTLYTTDYVYVLRQGSLPTRVEHEQHVLGLFPRQTWLDLLGEVGFEPHIVHDDYDRDVFVAHRRL